MSKTMTAEELRVWFALQQGYKWWLYVGQPIVWLSPAEVARDRKGYGATVVDDFSDFYKPSLQDVPSYLTDIAAAWPLIQLVMDYRFDPEFDRRCRWAEHWSQEDVVPLHAIADEATAARHICLAAYYALTGEHVEIVEAHDV